MTIEGIYLHALIFFPLGCRVLFQMIKSLRPLLLAGLLLPLALPVSAEPINTALSPNVEKALKASKLQDNALSLVMIPLTGPGLSLIHI